MSKKPKFRIGQIVFIDDLGFYGVIDQLGQQKPTPYYWLRTTPSHNSFNQYPEAELRALTSREIGKRKASGK